MGVDWVFLLPEHVEPRTVPRPVRNGTRIILSPDRKQQVCPWGLPNGGLELI
jgi:hypothetical protein